jgi:hypothetical protein
MSAGCRAATSFATCWSVYAFAEVSVLLSPVVRAVTSLLSWVVRLATRPFNSATCAANDTTCSGKVPPGCADQPVSGTRKMKPTTRATKVRFIPSSFRQGAALWGCLLPFGPLLPNCRNSPTDWVTDCRDSPQKEPQDAGVRSSVVIDSGICVKHIFYNVNRRYIIGQAFNKYVLLKLYPLSLMGSPRPVQFPTKNGSCLHGICSPGGPASSVFRGLEITGGHFAE